MVALPLEQRKLRDFAVIAIATWLLLTCGVNAGQS